MLSSSSPSSSSPVHAASLVHPSLHSPALLQLVDIKISVPLIKYAVDCVADIVDYSMELLKFTTFVTTVLIRAQVTTPVILVSLVYIARAKPHIHIAHEKWALERVFLGASIVASKYLNDCTLNNVHWGLCTGVFGKQDVGIIEREFLNVLDWELSVSEADILVHYAGILSTSRTLPRPDSPRPQPLSCFIS